MELGTLGELQMRSRGANGRSHEPPVPCTTLQMVGHLVWRLSKMTLWTGLKQQHSASDDAIGLNEGVLVTNDQSEEKSAPIGWGKRV